MFYPMFQEKQWRFEYKIGERPPFCIFEELKVEKIFKV